MQESRGHRRRGDDVVQTVAGVVPVEKDDVLAFRDVAFQRTDVVAGVDRVYEDEPLAIFALDLARDGQPARGIGAKAGVTPDAQRGGAIVGLVGLEIVVAVVLAAIVSGPANVASRMLNLDGLAAGDDLLGADQRAAGGSDRVEEVLVVQQPFEVVEYRVAGERLVPATKAGLGEPAFGLLVHDYEHRAVMRLAQRPEHGLSSQDVGFGFRWAFPRRDSVLRNGGGVKDWRFSRLFLDLVRELS